MKSKPIIFSGPMVRALLDGTKTQTRRVVKPQPIDNREIDGNFFEGNHKGYVKVDGHPDWQKQFAHEFSRFQPGDQLWVREACQHTRILNINPEDENYGYVYRADGQPWEDYEGWRWKPSIHMPREASRITLEVVSVRVERLQDISEADAIAEGVEAEPTGDYCFRNYTKGGYLFIPPYESYRSLWQSIHGPDSWSINPWVWVYEFRRVKP